MFQFEFDKRNDFVLFLIGSINGAQQLFSIIFIRMESSTQKKKNNETNWNGDFHKYSWKCIAFFGGLFWQTISFRFKECALVAYSILIANEAIVRFVNIKYRSKSIPMRSSFAMLVCWGKKLVNWNYKLFDSPKGKRFHYACIGFRKDLWFFLF